MIQAFAEDLWLAEGENLSFAGVSFGLRMTIVRLPDGKLWLHSPVAATAERLAAVAALGEVAHLVAPNRYHHLYLGEWAKAFPQARVWGAPGLAGKRPDISFSGVLADGEQVAEADSWGGVLCQQLMSGFPMLEEIWFLHRPSGTLIVTDLLQNHDPTVGNVLVRSIKALNRMSGPQPTLPRSLRLMIRGKAMQDSLQQVMEWDFNRLVLAHGQCLSSGARNAVAGLSALLE